MQHDNILFLMYDDDGYKLRPGDKVLVNNEKELTIAEDKSGRNMLKDWPDDEIIHNVELVNPPPQGEMDDDE
jgi:hypothetical protein